jgi:hypothetical protein
MTDRELSDWPNERSTKSARWSVGPPLGHRRHRRFGPDLAPQWEAVASSPALREKAERWRARELRRQREREPIERTDPEPEIELDLG